MPLAQGWCSTGYPTLCLCLVVLLFLEQQEQEALQVLQVLQVLQGLLVLLLPCQDQQVQPPCLLCLSCLLCLVQQVQELLQELQQAWHQGLVVQQGLEREVLLLLAKQPGSKPRHSARSPLHASCLFAATTCTGPS